MNNVKQDNLHIDAGWTYFGQFMSHDLTIRRELGEKEPRLNLDCLYGFGPKSNAYLYELYPRADNHKELLGVRFALDTYSYNNNITVYDVFRIGQGGKIPVMADVRNDDNFLLNQLHCTFLRFHNEMAKFFYEKYRETSADLFKRTRQFVTWTYQWLIVNEYLQLLTGDVAITLLKENGYKILKKEVRDKGPVLLPEFIAAALRMGHSQVREAYDINKHNRNFSLFKDINSNIIDLSGFRREDERGPVDWHFFFSFNNQQQEPQKSRPFDLFLASPMQYVPFPPESEHNMGEINIERSVQYDMIIQEKDLHTLSH